MYTQPVRVHSERSEEWTLQASAKAGPDWKEEKIMANLTDLTNTGITQFAIAQALEEADINGVPIFTGVSTVNHNQVVAVKRDHMHRTVVKMVISVDDMTDR